MEIGLSSAVFYPDVCTENSIEIMNGLGFDCGEIFLNSTSEYEEEFIEAVNEQRQKFSFRVNSVHGFCAAYEPFLFDRYKRRRDDCFKTYKMVCRAAKTLGANCLTFHGMRLMPLGDIDEKLVMDAYDKLAYAAAEEGIMLAQENVSWCMSSQLDFIQMLMEKCKYPIHFTLDLKQAYKAGTEPEEYMKIIGKKLVNLHINDKDEGNICLLPGKGNVDYDHIFQLLRAVEYDGTATIEVYRENYKSYNQIENARKYLCKYIQN